MNHALRFGILEVLRRREGARTTVGDLVFALHASATEVADALVQLDRKGLVDAGRVRLTMMGLAAASALAASSVSRAA
ncbi:MAG: hypothetical protein AAGE52_39790 [Myxococcota bacterium]